MVAAAGHGLDQGKKPLGHCFQRLEQGIELGDRLRFFDPSALGGVQELSVSEIIFRAGVGGDHLDVGEGGPKELSEGFAGALIPVVPSVDTLAVLDKDPDGTLRDSGEEVDRTRIFGAQTPQVFWSEDLKAAYNQGFDMAFTDDASVARRYGVPLSYIAGERNNIKLTTPEDLSLAEAILQLSC